MEPQINLGSSPAAVGVVMREWNEHEQRIVTVDTTALIADVQDKLGSEVFEDVTGTGVAYMLARSFDSYHDLAEFAKLDIRRYFR